MRFDSVTKFALLMLVIIGASRGTSSAMGDMLISSAQSHQVLRFSDAGAFLGVAASGGGLDIPTGIALGPGNSLFVGNQSATVGQVLRHNVPTGAFEGVFVPNLSGGLTAPSDIAFGVSGDLFVAGFFNDAVLRYDGNTGAFKGVFASAGGLDAPVGLSFGPGGDLFVASRGTSEILRYNGTTGGLLGRISVSARPFDLAFGSDGDLFVSSDVGNKILHYNYDGTTWAPEDVFATVSDPIGLAFGPGGDLFVSSRAANNVQRFDLTGTSKGVFISGGGLDLPTYMVYVAVPEPGSIVLFGAGAVGMGLASFRQARRKRIAVLREGCEAK